MWPCIGVDLSQFHCKLFMHWMQLILSQNIFITIHACARAKSVVNSDPVSVTQKFAGDLQTFPCISADMRKVKFFGPNTRFDSTIDLLDHKLYSDTVSLRTIQYEGPCSMQ